MRQSACVTENILNFYEHMAVATEEIPTDYRRISSGGFKTLNATNYYSVEFQRLSIEEFSPHLHTHARLEQAL
jgi:hypothetical protein